jgi:Xaa-Pro aminopeptidase
MDTRSTSQREVRTSMSLGRFDRSPRPDDFPAPPTTADRARWAAADRTARPARLDRLRGRLVEAGLDAYFGIRPEHARYLTGMALGDGEERVAGSSGWFLVGGDEVVLFADSRYRIQAEREAPDTRIEPVYGDLDARWPGILDSIGARRVAVEGAVVPHATWTMLAAAAPGVELVAVGGWLEADRAVKDPAELERVAAACAVADRALATLLPEIRVGATERELALRLEWLIRTGGGDGLAFDVACLAGPEAALPHGSPGDRPVRAGAVLLFDFGARLDGYRSDMTRTLFVGRPRKRDLALHALVAEAQATAIGLIEAAVRAGGPLPSGRAVDSVARAVIDAAGYAERFGHGTGHGIGLATHELPRLGRTASDEPLPDRTVFSVEPGVYLDGETGVRIEDLLAVDLAAGRCEPLTRFPRGVVVVGR